MKKVIFNMVGLFMFTVSSIVYAGGGGGGGSNCDDVSKILDLCKSDNGITSQEDTFTDLVIIDIAELVDGKNMTDTERRFFLRKLLAYTAGQITSPSLIVKESSFVDYYSRDDGGYSANITTIENGEKFQINIYKNRVPIPTFGIRSGKNK